MIGGPLTRLQISGASGATQLFKKEVPVYGLRLNLIYGVQTQVAGIDLGPFNETDSAMGLGVGVANISLGAAFGLQVGVAAHVEEDFYGLQTGFANMVRGRIAGAQLGIVNRAEEGAGFQLGIVNQSKSIKGLQLGLININENGFLPFFPIFNLGL